MRRARCRLVLKNPHRKHCGLNATDVRGDRDRQLQNHVTDGDVDETSLIDRPAAIARNREVGHDRIAVAVTGRRLVLVSGLTALKQRENPWKCWEKGALSASTGGPLAVRQPGR